MEEFITKLVNDETGKCNIWYIDYVKILHNFRENDKNTYSLYNNTLLKLKNNNIENQNMVNTLNSFPSIEKLTVYANMDDSEELRMIAVKMWMHIFR